MNMEHISKKAFASIGDDYKSVYMDYQGVFPKRKGRRTAFLPGHGTTLFTEGIHFLVDGEYTHLPGLTKENAEEGAAYRFGDNDFLIVQRIYRISEEYARENGLAYLDRVQTTAGDFALPEGDTLASTKGRKL